MGDYADLENITLLEYLESVDYAPFREIPTNLFSFYYGLPDEREALRELVRHLQ